MSKLHTKIIEITDRIIDRSKSYRKSYLNNITAMEDDNDIRDTLAKYANDVLEEEEAAPKATVESVEDNVVKVKFN